MARKRKPQPVPLDQIKPGDVFALPMEDGRWTACRVLRTQSEPPSALVVSSTWTGDVPPSDLTDPRLTATLALTHHSWNGAPRVHWVTDPAPAEALRVGNIPPDAEEAQVGCNAWGAWESIPYQAFRQWRWDHEREAVLAEDERERQQREADTQEARYAYRPLPPSLEELRRKKHFAGWSGYVEPQELRLSRRIVRDAIDELIALGPDGDEAEKFDVFRRAAERFNENGDFICTIEREDVCEALDEIAVAAGLADYDVAAWRDW